LLALLILGSAAGHAAPGQAPAGGQAPPETTVLPRAETTAAGLQISLTAGRSTVLTTDFEITRIAVTNPAVADAVVVQPREILVDGKAPGTVSLIVWGRGGRNQYDVIVHPGVSALQQELRALFPGEDIRLSLSGDAAILSGQVSNNAVWLRAGEIARNALPKSNVINMLELPGGHGSQQVMLQVRVAEINRRALTEAGFNFFTGPAGFKGYLGRSTTQQFSAPDFDGIQPDGTSRELIFSDFLNLFLFNTEEQLGGVIRALKQRGWFQTLAEPNLIAYNNQEASFLAGGELPVPIVQGNTGTVGIFFKEFGVRLNFRPTIAGDVIRLHVRPEVSALDFANGITISGFRIPALTTRRAETEVELRDGQSFAIAGLLNNLSQNDSAAIPLLGSIPIIGHLFRSKADRAERTELMVLVTPRLVRALDPDEVPPLPTLPQRFLPPGEDVGAALEGGGGLVDAPAVKQEEALKRSPAGQR
jgi:pilus assembly protein CpaC